jgi:hypothetical protein
MTDAIKWGSEFLASPRGATPKIAALSDGKFAVSWVGIPENGTHNHVYVQLFNADGSPAGDEQILNPASDDKQVEPSIVGLADGGFALAWTDIVDRFTANILGQIFDDHGAKVGNQFVLNSDSVIHHVQPTLAARPDGGFVASWSADDANLDTVDATVRLFNADGTPASQELHSLDRYDHALVDPVVGALANGRFVTTFGASNDADVHARIFKPDGSVAVANITVNPTNDLTHQAPAILGLADGRFAEAWQNTDDDFTSHLTGQFFDAAGNKSGNPFAIDTADTSASDVHLAQLRDGRLVATWEDTFEIAAGAFGMPDGTFFSNIHGQLLNQDGTKSGGEFLVNSEGAGWLGTSAVTALADGRFVVTWGESFVPGDSIGFGNHAQIFDPREGAVELTGSARGDDLVGTAFNDTMRGQGGNDHLDGGAGDDTAVFSHPRDQYVVTQEGNMTTVSGPDGTDTLANFEHLRFADDATGPSQPSPDTPQAPDPSSPTPPDDPGSHIIGLVDTRFYLAHYTDVSVAQVSAIDHFNTYGWHEGRDPNAFFDTAGYRAANPELKASGENPLDHYHQVGWRQGLDPAANFDTRLYLIHNPDVATAGIDPLEHYLAHGMAEGRQAYAAVGTAVNGFDAEWYLFHNPDVAAAGLDPLAHFNANGWHEGRNPNAWFDTNGYLAHYADVAAAGINPLQHYEQYGWQEGRDPSAGFDTLGYLAANPDVAAAHVNPLDHFINNGIYEGRAAVNDGLWH